MADKKHPKYDPNVEAEQEKLKEKGFYRGEIDGVDGPATQGARDAFRASGMEAEERDAAARARADKIRLKELEVREQEAKRGEKKETAEAEEIKRRTKAKEEYDRQAQSPEGVFTETTAGAPSALAGVAIGREMGKGVNYWMDESQKSKNATLRGAAQDRISGLTTRSGARSAVARAGALPSENALLRVGGRMLPHAGLGTIMAGKGALMLSQEGEEDPFYPKMINRGAGIGMIGAGSGFVEQGLRYGVAPGVAPDAQSIAIIESNQLRRNAAPVDRGTLPPAPPQPALPPPQKTSPKPVAPGSKAYYVEEAKKLGVKGATRKNKAALIESVNEANKSNVGRRVRVPKTIPGLAGPAIAAGLAYAATPDDAYAGTGDSITGQDRALTNAGVAGGIGLGANRLLQAVPAIGRAMGPIGAGVSAYDYASQARDARGALPPGIAGDIGAQVVPLAMRGASDIEAMRNLPGQAQEFVERNQSDPMSGMSEEVQALPEQPEDFDAQIADLQALFADLDGDGQPDQVQTPRGRPMASPRPPYPMSPMPQNRLLAR